LLPYILFGKYIYILALNSQPREPALCQLYQHTLVPHLSAVGWMRCCVLVLGITELLTLIADKSITITLIDNTHVMSRLLKVNVTFQTPKYSDSVEQSTVKIIK